MVFGPLRTGDPKIDRNLDAIAAAVNPALIVPQPAPWVSVGTAGAAVFSASWGNLDATTYAPASYRKDSLGVTWLRGVIKNTSGGSLGTAIFTIPKGLRPDSYHIFPGETNDAFWEFEVRPDGTVVPRINVAAGAHATLFACWLAVP